MKPGRRRKSCIQWEIPHELFIGFPIQWRSFRIPQVAHTVGKPLSRSQPWLSTMIMKKLYPLNIRRWVLRGDKPSKSLMKPACPFHPYGHGRNLDRIPGYLSIVITGPRWNKWAFHWYCMFYFQKNALLREGTHRVHQREGPSRALSSLRARFAIA